MILKIFRPASAMIELIFAIVVMGIALLSAPMMLETAGKSNNIAFEQESIAIVAAQVSSMLTYAWDEQNTQANPASRDMRLASQGDTELNGNNAHVNASLRKRDAMLLATVPITFGMNKENETIGSVIHVEVIPDDVDDFHNTKSHLTLAKSGDQTSTDGDIMDTNITMITLVTYLNDEADYASCNTQCVFSRHNDAAWNAVGNSTNIKLISTELTSGNIGDKIINLRAFMCNMGAAQPNTRADI